MIVALGGVAQDARRAATAWIADVVPGDEVVTSIRPIGPTSRSRPIWPPRPGVARVSPIATFEVAFRGVRLDAAAVVGARPPRRRPADVRRRRPDRRAQRPRRGRLGDRPGEPRRRLGLRVGDELGFPVGGGRDGPAAGRRDRRPVDPGAVRRVDPRRLVGRDRRLRRQRRRCLRGPVRAGRDGRATGPALAAVAGGYALEANPVDRIAGPSRDPARVFGLFDALALVAVIVAALGIVNTLTMNVYERVREIGVLRATGMTRPQVWRMVVVEAGVLGVVGAILGCLTGIVVGAVVIGSRRRRAPPARSSRTGGARPRGGRVRGRRRDAGRLLAGPPRGRVSIVRAVQFE